MLVKIAICEDDTDFSFQLKDGLSKIPGFSVVGIAHSRKEIEILLGLRDVDLYFVDLGFPDISGIEVIQRIRQVNPAGKVVVLTSFAGRRSIAQCLELGINGYIFKDEIFFNLAKCVTDVMRDGASLSPQVASVLIETLSKKEFTAPSTRQQRLYTAAEFGVSHKEFNVFELAAQGVSVHIIAENLNISVHTVNKHLQSLYRKLKVHSKLEAIKVAKHAGFID